MDKEVPYWFTNEKWWHYDEDGNIMINDDVPEDVRRSWIDDQKDEIYEPDVKAGIVGLAIGDAMGVPTEFRIREKLMANPITDMVGYGSHNVPKGSWSDDTSMTLCLIDAINNSGEIIPDDIATNFVRWAENGEFTPEGRRFDIGRTCLQAIINYERGEEAVKSGLNNEMSNGNGSLMRILPVAYYCFSRFNWDEDKEIYELVKQVSSITHAHEISIMACYIYVKFAIELLYKKDLKQAYENIKKLDYKYFSDDCKKNFSRIIEDNIQDYKLNEISSSGYVVDTLEATFWTIFNTDSYDKAIISAINMGQDTDTVGACVGGLAGIYYGFDSINENWKKELIKYDYIIELCDKFAEILLNN